MLQDSKLTSWQAGKLNEAPAKTTTQGAVQSDAKTAAKQIETVFLNELLKNMMEQTSFGKDRTVSTFLPAITSELSKSLAERGGIGLGDFFLKGNGLQATDQKPGGLMNKNNTISRSGVTG